jgi:predicted nucleic acid-binding protein
MDLVEVTEDIARSAGDIAEDHGLRGYDAIHLASVLMFGSDEVLLATWDRDLAMAARTEGLDVGGLELR